MGSLSALPRCAVCEENLGIVVSCESFFACSSCGADLSSYNMVDAGLPGFLCLLCVLCSDGPARGAEFLVATPMAVNMGRVSAHRAFVRWGASGALCSGCGRGVSRAIDERFGLGGLCFSCIVVDRAGDMFVGLSRDFLGLMYWVVTTDCLHDPAGGYGV